ncbi:hypothetical protein [Corynebacterium sp.]|uniref:hypothetical protein n=1 Tax=Corynebacterium sp. TaxID=1720 RepID=UPI0028A719BE|nr:hypothetical protein [Corynebacterium sp.]
MVQVNLESAHIRHTQDFIECTESMKAKFGSLPKRVTRHLDAAIDAANEHKQNIEALPIKEARISGDTRATK